ncbi:hypothetical protein MBLNU230_g0717t1 [Neophaeotheca triangularis]
MQFHLNGFLGSSDPLKLQYPHASEPDFQTSLPETVDVLVIGSGPAGLLLASQLAQFPDITTRIIESKPGRLEQGQADGLQCRTVEIFEAFGFADKVLKEAYWVNETTFWSPGEDGELRRSGRIRDTEDGLSEFPHVILNQARLHDFWLEAMKWSPTRLEPTYGRSMVGLKVPSSEAEPVEVRVKKKGGEEEVVHAKYVVGCDGARSKVRQSLGLELKGDAANQGWGVMDCLVVSDFPDLRLKSAIHSANEGSILIIPREGGYMIRLYIELDKLQQNERIASKNITPDILIDRAQRIFHPYTLDVKEVCHWSFYEVGQRLTNRFDDVPLEEKATRDPRVFIAGDACHTHSAKAGQGMNVSMNDTYNLGWKLASVLHGTSPPSLLHTYTTERQSIAKTLIDFDREISSMFAAKPSSTAHKKEKEEQAIDPALFQTYFTRQGRFMAGLETVYPPSRLTSATTTHQHLATGIPIGQRFHSAQVLRLADAKPLQLGHILKADGRWRILLFSPASSPPTDPSGPLYKTCTWLNRTLVPRYTPRDRDPDSVLDVRCILSKEHSRLNYAITEFPSILFPRKGKYGLKDFEKVFTDEVSYNFGGGTFFADRGVSEEAGCLVVVRPDQYVAGVWPMDGEEGIGIEGLETFFGGCLLAVAGKDRRKDDGVDGDRDDEDGMGGDSGSEAGSEGGDEDLLSLVMGRGKEDGSSQRPGMGGRGASRLGGALDI